jgi:chromosome segregation ATPase
MDVALNQISDLNTRIVDLDRFRKQLESEKLSMGSAIDELREQIHIEVTKYNILNASIDKLRGDLEKKIAAKEEELESFR